MQQAILLSEIDNGSAKEWTKAGETGKDPDTGLYEDLDAQNSEIYFDKYLKNYLKYLSTSKDEDTNLFKVLLNDGSSLLMRNGRCIDFIYDYNGDRIPNKEGRDRYRFLLCPEAESQYIAGKLITYQAKYNSNETRTQKLNQCKSSPTSCSFLLEHDNWEFKSDYPFRL